MERRGSGLTLSRRGNAQRGRDLVNLTVPSKVLLDEIPAAYKDIDEVMEHARDLVEVKYVLKQFVNVKGD